MTDELVFAFLMSSERSGSNLAARLLDSHPEVCAPVPSQLFRFLACNAFRYGDLAGDEAWSALVDDAALLLAAQHGVWRRQLSAAEIHREVPERSLTALLETVYRAEAASHGKSRVFVKENHVHEYFGFLEASFPQAKYLYVVRDPRDMALSWKRTAGLRGGAVRAAGEWLADQRGFLRMAGWLAAGGRVLALRYETLIRQPEAVLERICDFLGLPYSPAMLAFHEGELTRQSAARMTAWRNLARPLMRDNSGQWRDGLTAPEIRYVEALCAAEMATLGYHPELDDGSTDLEALERELRPLEPVEKSAFRRLPEAEIESLARFREAIATIQGRPAALEVL